MQIYAIVFKRPGHREATWDRTFDANSASDALFEAMLSQASSAGGKMPWFEDEQGIHCDDGTRCVVLDAGDTVARYDGYEWTVQELGADE